MKKRVLRLFLAFVLCLTLLPTAARAADETHSSHPVCGSVDGTTCPDAENHREHGEAVDFEEMYYDTATKELVCGENRRKNYNDTFGYKIDSGKYYLSDNITLDALIYIDTAEDVTICLNGHSITVDADGQAIAIAGNSKLTLCDCQDGGTITHGTDSGKKYIGCGVLVNSNAAFTMYGGSITGNQAESLGAGVSVSSGGSFAMYGGKVTENTVSGAQYGGAGVYTSNGATIGGSAEISKNEAPNGQGAGIYCGNGDLRIQGNAKIIGNKAPGGEGGGVYMASAGTKLTVSGDATITGNTAANGGGVYVHQNITLVLQDRAAITDNTAITTKTGATDGLGGVYIDFGTLEVSGSVQVTGNYRKEGSERKDSNAYVDRYNIAVVGALTDDASIGVTVHETVLDRIKSNKDYSQPIATATTADWIPEGRFTHDGGNGLYGISVNDDGTQALLRHNHVWKITASNVGHTFSEKCSSCDEEGGSVTLTEPAKNSADGQWIIYDGSTVWRPEVTKGKAFHIPVTYSGMYRGINEAQGTTLDWDADAAWRNAGHYYITIEGGGQTDTTLQYTVQPKVLEKDDFDVTLPEGAVYDGVTDWLEDVSVTPKHSLGADGTVTWGVLQKMLNPDYPETGEQYRYSLLMDGKTIKAGTYVVSAKVQGATNYQDAEVPANWEERWTYTVAPANYTYVMPETANLVEGSVVEMLPKGTGIGVNGETVKGTLEWYTYDVQGNLVEVKQGNLDGVSCVGNSFTLYWVFTATNTNYTTTPKSGSVVFTIVEPPEQDLRITTSVSSKEHVAELERFYGYPEFFLDVQNSPDGGTIDYTYAVFENDVAKVEKTSGGGLMVTIKGAGTTTIKVTAAAVSGKYRETAAICELTVTPLAVTFSAQVENKIYDGTRDAKVNLTLSGMLSEDEDKVYVIAADAKFETPDVGVNRLVYIDNVRLGGAAARNYVVNYGASQQRPLASILKKTIWLESVDRADKEYDGSADYTVSGEVFEGLLPGVTLTRGVDYDISGYFPDADADETDQTVNVSVAYKNNENTKNYVLSPDDGKYTFPGWARITKAPAPQVTKTGAMTIYNQKKETYTFDVTSLLPTLESSKTYGTISGTVTAVALNDGYYDKEANGAKIEDGKLLLPIESVSSSTTGKIGTVTVTVTTSNYEDIILTIDISAANQPVSSGGSSSDPTYSVSTPSKTENGTVTVSPKSASKGDTVTVTVKPDSGYVLETLTVTDKNGNDLKLTDKGNGKYTFTMPAGKVEVKASFVKEIETSPFADVATDAYYYEAVKWAADKGITGGIGNGLFGPNQPCTRAQIVTFLWRTAGSSEPKGAASGMTDVAAGSYYEKAVAWAIENGITTGTTASTFSPDATCTRAQAVTFLARALNAKAAGKAEFNDVPTDSYFAEAVAWAAANGVTTGIGNGLFGPNNNCTRAQIVAFLWRSYSTK